MEKFYGTNDTMVAVRSIAANSQINAILRFIHPQGRIGETKTNKHEPL